MHLNLIRYYLKLWQITIMTGKLMSHIFQIDSLKMQQDLVNRTVWQARTRVGHRVYAELPLSLQTQQGYSLLPLQPIWQHNTSLKV